MAGIPGGSRSRRVVAQASALGLLLLVLAAGCTPAVPSPSASAPTSGPSGDVAPTGTPKEIIDKFVRG